MHTAAKIGIAAGIVIAVIVGGGVALFYMVIGDIENQLGINMSIEELEALRTDAPYSELVANNDQYLGSVVKETGKIVSVEEIAFGELAYLVDAGGEYYMLYHPTVGLDDAGWYTSFYGTVAGLDTVQLSGEGVRAVFLNGEDVILSDAPFN